MLGTRKKMQAGVDQNPLNVKSTFTGAAVDGDAPNSTQHSHKTWDLPSAFIYPVLILTQTL